MERLCCDMALVSRCAKSAVVLVVMALVSWCAKSVVVPVVMAEVLMLVMVSGLHHLRLMGHKHVYMSPV